MTSGFDGHEVAVGLWIDQQAQIGWFTPQGEPLGTPQVLGQSPYFPPAAAATYLEPYWLAVWTDPNGSVWLQRFDRQHQPVGSRQLVLTALPGQALMVRGLAASGGRALLVLQDNQADGRGSLYAQWLNADGTKHGSIVLLRDVGDGEIELPALAAGSQGVLVVWQWGNGEDRNTPEARLVRAGAAGAEPGALLTLGTVSADDNPVAVAFDGERFLAVWNYSGPDGPAPGWDPHPEMQLHGRFVTADGALSGPEFTLVAEEHNVLPGLGFDGNQYLLIWSQSVTGQEHTWFQYWDRHGMPVGDRQEIIGWPTAGPTEFAPVFPAVQFVGTHYLVGLNVLRFIETDEHDVLVGSDLYGAMIPPGGAGPVAAPARLTFAGWSAEGHARLRIEGTPQATYRVEWAPAVTGPWSILGTGSPGGDRHFEMEDPQGREAHRFYRAVAE